LLEGSWLAEASVPGKKGREAAASRPVARPGTRKKKTS